MSLELVPTDATELAAVLTDATRSGHRVRILGGGSASRAGVPGPPADLVVSTRGLDGIVDHQPADLTVTVRAGTPLSTLQDELARVGQTWIQAPERAGATVGGVISTATSGHRRLRFGAIRDSVLQVVICTGDGRIVTSGGKTVKGVAGYDIPRLVTGARGTLGVITEVTLKLWPRPATTRWCSAPGNPGELAELAGRIRQSNASVVSMLLDNDRLWVELMGPAVDLAAPDPLVVSDTPPPPLRMSAEVLMGVPAGRIGEAGEALAGEGLAFRLWPGVGTCQVEVTTSQQVEFVHRLADRVGGHAVVQDAPDTLRRAAWGPEPAGLAIMTRLRAAFDPAGILNPWLAPGAAQVRT